MPTEQSIQPLNVAAATLLVQLLLITLLAIASSLYQTQRWAPRANRPLGDEPFAPIRVRKSPTLFVALATFAALLISDELYSTWSPIFQGVGINTISAAKAIGIVFILDLLLVAYLMATTGGSRSSPFLSALFTIPALAIFLRLPPSMLLTFTGSAALIYLFLLPEIFDRRQPGQFAAAFINLSCLCLSIFTGYITRPVPINELQPKAQSAAPSNAASATAPLITNQLSQ